MNEAIYQAKLAFEKDEVPVGGILVDIVTNEIIAKSFNRVNEKKSAIYHCEIDLIINACKKLSSKYLNNLAMFVTLEPCLMCASAIKEAHIKKLYFGAYDEKKGGVEKNKLFSNEKHAFKTEVYGGIMEKECNKLLKEFFKEIRQ
jgi:tRNA(adenine34) deaminase